MRRIAAVALAGLGLLPAAALAAATVPSVGELQGPATGLTVGPDGALWHTAGGEPPRVGRTTLAGRTLELALPDAAARPSSIITGPDRALWFTDESGSIGRLRVDAVYDTVARTPGGSPQDLALGPGGDVWITIAGTQKKASGSIGRLSAAGELTTFSTGLTGQPQAITAGWDGAMWFTEPDAGFVGRIAADGSIQEFAATGGPTGIVAGPDGAMWFTAREGAIGRVTLTGLVGETSVGLTRGSEPGDITRGPDGALWFTLRHGLGRVTTLGAIVTGNTPGMRPGELVFASDGALWFTDAKHASLGRLSALATVKTPVPKLGKTVVAGRKAGEVRVKVPGRERFDALPATATIPVGSVVDATEGRVAVRTALDDAGHSQVGTFYGGRFEVLQSPMGGLVRIKLRGHLDCGTPRRASTARKRRKRRRVWGSDSGGQFQTLGLDSVTTVRGTKWLTEDRCSGTFTRVVRGSVVVRERRTGKRFVLRAGDRHLARHRP